MVASRPAARRRRRHRRGGTRGASGTGEPRESNRGEWRPDVGRLGSSFGGGEPEGGGAVDKRAPPRRPGTGQAAAHPLCQLARCGRRPPRRRAVVRRCPAGGPHVGGWRSRPPPPPPPPPPRAPPGRRAAAAAAPGGGAPVPPRILVMAAVGATSAPLEVGPPAPRGATAAGGHQRLDGGGLRGHRPPEGDDGRCRRDLVGGGHLVAARPHVSPRVAAGAWFSAWSRVGFFVLCISRATGNYCMQGFFQLSALCGANSTDARSGPSRIPIPGGRGASPRDQARYAGHLGACQTRLWEVRRVPARSTPHTPPKKAVQKVDMEDSGTTTHR